MSPGLVGPMPLPVPGIQPGLRAGRPAPPGTLLRGSEHHAVFPHSGESLSSRPNPLIFMASLVTLLLN